MDNKSIAGIVSGADDQEAAEQVQRLFSYLAKAPQHYPQVRQFLIENDQLDAEDLPEQMSPEQIATVAQVMQPFAGEPRIGDLLASQGRNGDTMMAHVNPQEMQLLQSVGGSGTVNPATGMPEFGLSKFFKSVVKPIVGAVVGFAIGGPMGAVIGGSTGAVVGAQDSARKSAEAAAAEQARLQQEFENQRRAEAAAEAERIRVAEERRQANITQGANDIASVFSQFGDDFYNKRSQDYIDYAMPTLDRQYQEQERSLVAELARSGNLNSSLRGDMMGKLRRQYDTNKLNIQDQANAFSADARAKVQQARSGLLESNARLADPGTIRTMAEAQAAGVAVPQQYGALGQMIADLSGGISGGNSSRRPGTTAGVSLYTNNAGSGRVVS